MTPCDIDYVSDKAYENLECDFEQGSEGRVILGTKTG